MFHLFRTLCWIYSLVFVFDQKIVYSRFSVNYENKNLVKNKIVSCKITNGREHWTAADCGWRDETIDITRPHRLIVKWIRPTRYYSQREGNVNFKGTVYEWRQKWRLWTSILIGRRWGRIFLLSPSQQVIKDFLIFIGVGIGMPPKIGVLSRERPPYISL